LFYLDQLSELRIYSNRQITALKKGTNSRNSNIVFFSGNTREDLTQMINSNLFSPSFFRGVYVPRAYHTQQLNKRIIVDQKAYYDSVRSKSSNIIYTKRALGDYNGSNVYYDLTVENKDNEEEIKIRGRKRVDMYMEYLVSKVKEGASYDSRAVLIPIPDRITDNSFFDLNKVNTPFGYVYTAIKRRLVTDAQKQAFEGVDFIFYTPTDRTFAKFRIDSDMDNLKINRFLGVLATLIKMANRRKLSSKDAVPSGVQFTGEQLVRGKTDSVMGRLLNGFKASQGARMSDTATKIADHIEDMVSKTIEKDVLADKSEDEILEVLNKDIEIKKSVNEIKELQKVGGDNSQQQRVLERLRGKQSDVSLGDTNIQDIIDSFGSSTVEPQLITNSSVIQEETKKTNLKDFDYSYFEKQMKQDLVSVVTAFNKDSDVKLFVTGIKTEDTSDDLSKKITYTVNLTDERNVRHTVKFDYPIIKDARFMNINGGKKLILKQIMLLPIVKTKSDTVQITTNYNKFFVYRFGSKLSQKTEKLKKFFASDLKEFAVSGKKFNFRLGSALTVNSAYQTTLEYSELSSFLLGLETNKMSLFFNQKELNEKLSSDLERVKKLASIKYDKEEFLPIGYLSDMSKLVAVRFSDKKVYYVDSKGASTDGNGITEEIIHLVGESLDSSAFDRLSRFTNAKTLAYSRVKINNRMVPLAVLMGYELGLKGLMDRYGIKHSFEEKNRRVSLEDNEEKIRFKDGYLFYDSTLLRNTLLLSGLSTAATEEYDFEEFDTKAPYVETFYNLFGSRNMGKGFHNTVSLMVDPITLDVLKHLSLPENIYDILLYANTLLEDTSYQRMNDMSSYRIRGAEQVNAYLYKILADSFATYKNTMMAGNPIKMSVPQDALIKRLLESPTVDEYSVLNPSLEIEKIGAATYKGLSGINMDMAYTKDIRAYDPSMKGILAMSSPDSDKVGVVRQLTYDPAIKNTRGFLDTDPNTKNNSTSLYGPAELLSSFTAKHADPPRIGIKCVPPGEKSLVKNSL
jgi:hypothetical protein